MHAGATRLHIIASRLAVITIGIDPEIRLGPVTLAWHGITIALGILLGAIIAARWLRRRGLDVDPLYTIVGSAAIGALVGGRIFSSLEHDPGATHIARPADLRPRLYV